MEAEAPVRTVKKKDIKRGIEAITEKEPAERNGDCIPANTKKATSWAVPYGMNGQTKETPLQLQIDNKISLLSRLLLKCCKLSVITNFVLVNSNSYSCCFTGKVKYVGVGDMSKGI